MKRSLLGFLFLCGCSATVSGRGTTNPAAFIFGLPITVLNQCASSLIVMRSANDTLSHGQPVGTATTYNVRPGPNDRDIVIYASDSRRRESFSQHFPLYNQNVDHFVWQIGGSQNGNWVNGYFYSNCHISR
jgi:hypothetical protein